ncbi:hypothetical protein ABKV19_014624 [Rosa sericea]
MLLGFESAGPAPETLLRYVHRVAARHGHRDAARHGHRDAARHGHRDAARHGHRDAARHGSSGRCPAWFIGLLPGMVHRVAARHGSSETLLRHVVFDIIDTRRCRCGRACNREEEVVESDGRRPEPFVFQAALLLSASAFPRCCAPLRPPVVLFTLRRCVLPLFSFHVVLLYCTDHKFDLYRVLEFNLE